MKGITKAAWKLRQSVVWLSRIGHCRGFGIQSPWAYGFVCHIINNRYPYHGYGDVERMMPELSPLARKLGRMYLRIANNVRPKTTVSIGASGEACKLYIKAGCGESNVSILPADSSTEAVLNAINGTATIDMLCIAPMKGCHEALKAAMKKAHEGSVFIIEGIKSDAEGRTMWRDVVENTAGVVTFDLYYCGVVCFKEKLFKRNYIVNF